MEGQFFYLLHEWMQIPISRSFPLLIAVGCIFLIPLLILAAVKLAAKEDVASQILGRKHRRLLNPSLRQFFADMGTGWLLEKIIPLPIDLFTVWRLKYLVEKNREAAVRLVYKILKKKGKGVPKEAWREFYRRNPEAKGLKCPVDLAQKEGDHRSDLKS